MKLRKLAGTLAVFAAIGGGGGFVGAHAENLPDKIQRMEQELEQMKQELQRQKEVQEKAQAEQRAKEQAAKPATEASSLRELTDRVKLGGYGSFRFEGSDLKDQKASFVFRRLVLTADANIAPHLRSYVELEFERFRKLEIEKSFGPSATEQGIEATNHSEISLEQAWMQYDIEDWLKFRGGGILVPLGRFNLNHDDNRWDLPRRSLIDRGVPVLPSTAAWDEIGLGFLGDLNVGEQGELGYQVYVMNGVALDSEFEQVVKDGKAVTEVKLSPSTGGFASDVKDSKAIAGRVAYSPALGHELAGSWYYGQYTPDFLGKQDLWALSADGRTGRGPFELEGEFVLTRFDGTHTVAKELADTVHAMAPEATTAAFTLANLARNRYGYWVEARYRFWPAFLNETFLGRSFGNPQLIAVLRPEQAWLDDLIEEIDIGNAVTTSNRRVDCISIGLAYRPVPLVVFQLAYEYTRTDSGKSLATVTNFLPARAYENDAQTVLVGIAFGF